MKKLTVLIICFYCIQSIALSGQTAPVGIYLSASDYVNGKLSYSSSEKIKLKTFFYSPYITVKTGNSTIKLNKDSIFGYRDADKNDYRFNRADERIYKIVENKSIVIYTADMPVTTAKGNAIQLVKSYFYSNTLTSEIKPLITNK